MKLISSSLWFLAAGAVCAVLAGCSSTTTRPLPPGEPGTVGVASLEKVRLGGVDQWILIRGTNRDAPLVLKIHGGPGQAEMAAVGYNAGLERDFVVVEWDQRGAGQIGRVGGPGAGHDPRQDCGRYGGAFAAAAGPVSQRQADSGGPFLGQRGGRPGRSAGPRTVQRVRGHGLITDTRRGWIETWHFLVDEAGRRQNTAALRELGQIGPPPYDGRDRAHRREVFARWIDDLGASWHSPRPMDRVGMMVSAPEYSWPEKLAFLSAAGRSFTLLWPDLEAVDLKVQVPRLEVPVFVAAAAGTIWPRRRSAAAGSDALAGAPKSLALV